MTAPTPDPAQMPLEHPAVPDELGRRWWIVNAIKRPRAERDVARAVLTEATFYDMVGADCPDDDPHHPVGTEVAYAALLTDRQAEGFRAQSNALSVVPDQRLYRLDNTGDGLRRDGFPSPAPIADHEVPW